MNWTEIITAPFRLVIILAALVILSLLIIIVKICSPKKDMYLPSIDVIDFIMHGNPDDSDY